MNNCKFCDGNGYMITDYPNRIFKIIKDEFGQFVIATAVAGQPIMKLDYCPKCGKSFNH